MTRIAYTMTTALTLVLMGCTDAAFVSRDSSPNATTSQPPAAVTPTPTPTPTPSLPLPVLTAGPCASGQVLTSCLTCQVPTPAPWVPSTKADRLALSMFLSCGIPNASNPQSANARQPSLNDIRSRLAACTPKVFPDTIATLPPSGQQTVLSLINPADSSMRHRFYSGLWYQPPFTDYFEQYYGVESQTIREVLCYDADAQGSLSGFDYTTPYARACGGGGNGDSCESWQSNPTEQAAWNALQSIRAQLRSCIDKPGTVTPIPGTTPPTCTYQTFSGSYQLGGAAVLADLEAKPGMQISVEYNNMCYNPTNLSSLPVMTSGLVTISGYSCQ